ncbi:hypothetical protein [Alteromonas sp. a30]|uniref:hypothetical protein n=1 Tax=Alteromonas sp. a30 TaxID=2730917 RepID=UPI00227F002D|nr:hypothetical protein [Alteromonas sp. a30]MCY7296159.1 hypothetical protein [Alteromonas sp. a30]
MLQQSLQQTRSTQIISHLTALSATQALLTRKPPSTSTGIKLLHFHVINTPDKTAQYFENSAWLNEVQHIAYQYQRAKNVKRVLFSDGILCDLHLHSSTELCDHSRSQWNVVWEKPGYQLTAYPSHSLPCLETQTEWLLGELLTHLTLGLRCFANGEKLAAFQCIQQRSLNHLLTLLALKHFPEKYHDSTFNWEQHFPELAGKLNQLAPGYEASPEAAQSIIEHLSQLHNFNHFIKDQILNLISACLKSNERNSVS